MTYLDRTVIVSTDSTVFYKWELGRYHSRILFNIFVFWLVEKNLSVTILQYIIAIAFVEYLVAVSNKAVTEDSKYKLQGCW